MSLMNSNAEPFPVWQGETPLVCRARCDAVRDCATFVLAAPDARRFDFDPGQFISLGVDLDGRTHWRAYSIASSPNASDRLAISVKRVPGGRVSNWLLDHWHEGMALPARAPAGDFGLARDAELPARIALFSAGSGITPLMSMTRWLLEREASAGPVEIDFFHSARSDADVLYAEELRALAAAHPRFRLHLFLSQPEGRLPAHAGRLDAARLRAALRTPDGLRAWLCGQSAYMDDVADWLGELGVDAADIRRERYFSTAAEVAADAARHRLQVPTFGIDAEIAAGELLLDALEGAGVPIVGACRTGVCGSCKCKVEGDAGAVTSTSTVPLTADEIAAGVVLACSTTVNGEVSVSLA